MSRNKSQFALVLAVSGSLIACQSPRPAGSLRVAPSQIALPGALNTAAIAPNTVATRLQNLTGEAYFGTAPMSEAIVSIKDPLTGKVLGGGNTDNAGQFSVPIAVQPTSGLFQIVVSSSAGTVQAIEGLEASSPSTYLLTDLELRGRRVDWGSTLVAQTLGPKIIELSLTGDESRQHLKLLVRLRELSTRIAAKALNSFPEFRAQVLATPDVRETVTAIVNDVNSAIVAAFKTGQGPVFQVQPFNLPDAAIVIPGPTVTIDSAAGTVSIALDGRTETLQRAGLILDAGALNTLATSVSLLGNPTTALPTPNVGIIDSIGSSTVASPNGQQVANAVAATERSANSPSENGRRRSSGGGSGRSREDREETQLPQEGGEIEGPGRHEMAITDVLLAESAQSILGTSAPGALSYAPQGSQVRLIIKGKLTAEQPDDDDDDHDHGRGNDKEDDFSLLDNDEGGDPHHYYNPPNFPFPGLIQQTFVSNKPLRRVLLDDSILLPLAPGSSPSESQLEVILNTKALTDLAISKLHRITVLDRSREAVAEVRIANEGLATIPKPELLEVQMVGNVKFAKIGQGKSDNHEHGNSHGNGTSKKHDFSLANADNENQKDGAEIKYLRIIGKNLPVSFYAHWAQLNGDRAYAHATWVTDEPTPKTILFIHLPDGFSPRPSGENVLSYANPFGFQYVKF